MKKSFWFVLVMLLVLMIPVCILAAVKHGKEYTEINCSDYNFEEGADNSGFWNDINDECSNDNNVEDLQNYRKPSINGPDTVSFTEGYTDAGQAYTFAGYPYPLFTISANQPNTAGASLSGTTLIIPQGLAAAGSPYTVTLEAKNSIGTAAKTVTVTVSPAPAPPAIDGPDAVSLTEGYTDAGQAYTLTGFPAPGLTISAGYPNTAGASLSGTTLVVPPGLAAAGSPYTVTLEAANSIGTVAKTVTVAVSLPPAPPAIDGPDAVSLTEGYTEAGQNYTLTGNPAPGLTISATQPNTAGATLSGTLMMIPQGLTAAGSPYTVTLDAANTAGTVTKTVTVTVSPPPAPPAIDGPDAISLMEGYPDAGQNYTLTGWPVPDLTVSAGSPNTAGASISGTTLAIPQGLAAAGSPYTVTLDAINTQGAAAKTITVTVQPVSIVLSPASLPDAWSNASYPGAAITAEGGWAPYTFTVTAGSLPSGLSLDSSTGALGGTCEADALDYAFTLTASDSRGYTGIRGYTIRVYNGISLANTEFNAYYGGAATVAVGLLNASGGAGEPYTFAMAGGSLPNGCTLESNGLINGQPTESGDFTMLVRVTDSAGNSADISVVIHSVSLDP